MAQQTQQGGSEGGAAVFGLVAVPGCRCTIPAGWEIPRFAVERGYDYCDRPLTECARQHPLVPIG